MEGMGCDDTQQKPQPLTTHLHVHIPIPPVCMHTYTHTCIHVHVYDLQDVAAVESLVESPVECDSPGAMSNLVNTMAEPPYI